MEIRTESPPDFPAIATVVQAAFGSPREARLVEDVRASEHYVPELAFVAVEDGEVVGHTMLSYVWLDGADTRVLQLSPLAVAPEHQGRGIGAELTRAALRAADERREPLVLVLGHPSYYPRFGFRRATELGIEPADPAWGEAFMAIPLAAHDGSLSGRVRFPPAFD
jgi:putative acetyltransferase